MTFRIVTVVAAALALPCLALALAAPLAADEKDDERGDEKASADQKQKRADQEKAAGDQFAGLDKNGDGTLRGAEIPEGWAARFDRNGDGHVQKSEFVEVMGRPEKLRRLHPMRDARARAADSIRQFDQDKNGQVERAEYPGRDDVFRAIDRNKDMALQMKELLDRAEEELEDIRRQMQKPTRNEFLTLFDADRNNRVGPEEYDGPVGPFRKFDTDKDGVVTYDELYPERMAAMEASRPKPEDKSILASLDKDEDGKVSRAEFPGSDAAWARIDKNGDGFVTTADAR